MSLVSYGSSDDEEEKEEQTPAPAEPVKAPPSLNSKAPPKKPDPKDLPPLPDFFDEDEEGAKPREAVAKLLAKGETSAKSVKRKENGLMPVQLWKKKANISTEDTPWAAGKKKQKTSSTESPTKQTPATEDGNPGEVRGTDLSLKIT